MATPTDLISPYCKSVQALPSNGWIPEEFDGCAGKHGCEERIAAIPDDDAEEHVAAASKPFLREDAQVLKQD